MGAILNSSWLLLAGACAWCFVTTTAMRIPNFGVYGGTPVNITKVPFMAILANKPNSAFCGASIVHEQLLVTAAHCVVDGAKLVIVGTDSTDGGDQYDIEKVIIHPKFDYPTADYDISVIKLKNKLTLNDRVQPIKIADSSVNPSPGEMMETIGFGLTEHQVLSKHLLKVNIPYVERDKCAAIVNPKGKFKVTDRMICAGGEVGKSTCNGDSGGPLFYQGQLIGMVSWGVECGTDPGVFSYVTSMRDFIDDAINNNS